MNGSLDLEEEVRLGLKDIDKIAIRVIEAGTCVAEELLSGSRHISRCRNPICRSGTLNDGLDARDARLLCRRTELVVREEGLSRSSCLLESWPRWFDDQKAMKVGIRAESREPEELTFDVCATCRHDAGQITRFVWSEENEKITSAGVQRQDL